MRPQFLPATVSAAALAVLLAGASAAFSAEIVVTTTAESPGGESDCTLGEAIQAAEDDSGVDGCGAGSGADTIALPAGTYTLSTGLATAAGRSAFRINTAVRIVGRGVTLVRDPAAGSLRFFEVTGTGELTLDLLTLAGGLAQGVTSASGRGGPGEGGAVYNAGRLRLVYASLSGNRAVGGPGGSEPALDGGTGRGGAIYSIGSVETVRTKFHDNRAIGGAGGHGYGLYSSGGPGGAAEGGAVYSTGIRSSVVLTDSRLHDNRAEGGGAGWGSPAIMTGSSGGHASGGAVWGGGVAISGCMLESNVALGGPGKYAGRGEGGAIFGSGTMSVTTLRGNRAIGGRGRDYVGPGGLGAGGGLLWAGRIDRGALIDNVAEGGEGFVSNIGYQQAAGQGGGVSVHGQLTLTNVTLSGNAARGGPGTPWILGSGTAGGGAHVRDQGLIRLIHCTVAANASAAGASGLAAPNGVIQLAATVLANNTGPAGACSGLLGDAGDNLQYPGRTCGGGGEADPLLGPLETGARTMYHPLLTGSPARDAAWSTACPTNDQRGHTRPLDGDGDGVAVCDVGAIEANDPPGPGDLLFRDGFDSGDLSNWHNASTDGGDLQVTGAAALDATPFGLEALVDDTTGLYVEDSSPEQEDRYRARFYFDAGAVDPGTRAGHLRASVFIGFAAETGRRLFTLVLRLKDGEYGLMARARLDGNGHADGVFHPITRGTHVVEIDWRRSSTQGNDGWLLLWIDGVAAEQLTGLDNDGSALAFARLGAMGLKAGARGTLSFDGFESRRDSYIGP
jgi:hypothetical protein